MTWKSIRSLSGAMLLGCAALAPGPRQPTLCARPWNSTTRTVQDFAGFGGPITGGAATGLVASACAKSRDEQPPGLIKAKDIDFDKANPAGETPLMAALQGIVDMLKLISTTWRPR
ncbi:hypothetical protein ACTMU2_31385 [Cupriavidus basilensis]